MTAARGGTTAGRSRSNSISVIRAPQSSTKVILPELSASAKLKSSRTLAVSQPEVSFSTSGDIDLMATPLSLHPSFHTPLQEPYYSPSLQLVSAYFMGFNRMLDLLEERLHAIDTTPTLAKASLSTSIKTLITPTSAANGAYLHQYNEKYKVLLSSMSSLQLVTKQYAKIVVEKTLEKVRVGHIIFH